MAQKQPALGQGLSALIGDQRDGNDKSEITQMALSELHPGPFQPRYYFNEDTIHELSESIQKNGVLQPIIVRPDPDGTGYQIIAGERRWRAATHAGLERIPTLVKELDDQESLEVALIENIQRQSLTPIEEAVGYQRLIEEYQFTQDNLAKEVGKSRSHIANMLRLLQLPEEVKDLLTTGELSMGHARALVGREDAVEVARRIIADDLSVRQAEGFAQGKGTKGRAVTKKKNTIEKDTDILELEQMISDRLHLSVEIKQKEDGSGKIVLNYSNLGELDALLSRLQD